MVQRLLTRKILAFLFVVIVPMICGIGWQLTHAYLVDEMISDSRLLCEDGSRVKDRIPTDRRWIVAHLSEFGEQARSIWKHCVCQGFEGASCAALEVEISDQLQLSQLDTIQ